MYRFTSITLLLFFPTICMGGTVILSYNVWFNDASGKAHRYQQIINFIAQENPDYVCLQEVTPLHLRMLKNRFSSAYHLYHDGITHKDYGLVILTRNPGSKAAIIRLKTRMGRNGLLVRDQKYAIVNVHLESMLTDTVIREHQLADIKTLTEDFLNLIICGDFNFGDDEPENELISEFTDAGRKFKQFTYDVKNNQLAKMTMFPAESSRRLDRILVRLAETKNLRFAVKQLPYSDHYPVLLVVDE